MGRFLLILKRVDTKRCSEKLALLCREMLENDLKVSLLFCAGPIEKNCNR